MYRRGHYMVGCNLALGLLWHSSDSALAADSTGAMLELEVLAQIDGAHEWVFDDCFAGSAGNNLALIDNITSVANI